MTRHSCLVGLVLGLVLGCAATKAPLPPLAVPVATGPAEFRFKPLVWNAATTLTYEWRSYTEVRTGEEVDTHHEQHTLAAKVVERTAQNGYRVGVSFDGTEIGWVVFAQDGRAGDGVPARLAYRDALRGFARWAEKAVEVRGIPNALRPGETVRTELPAAQGQLNTAGLESALKETIDGEMTCVGWATLENTLVAVMATKSPNILRKPFVFWSKDGKTKFQIDTLSSEGLMYLDPTNGLELANYEVKVGTGTAGGRSMVFRFIAHAALDKKRSHAY
jgi:hypothetical protein